MRIIGIDPGSRCVGWGVVDTLLPAPHAQHVMHGVLRLNTENPLPQRIGELLKRLMPLLCEHKPQMAVVEEVFVSASPRSALLLGQARGAVLAILASQAIPIIDVRPARLKQSLTGSGRATKRQMAQMVSAVLTLEKPPPSDAADALALALYQARLISIGYDLHTQEPLRKQRKSTEARRKELEQLAKLSGVEV